MVKLYYVGKLERYHKVRTDVPLVEIWRFWLKYADFHYLAQEWPGHAEEEMLVVSTYIKQAYEFHIAARTATTLTSPLLIYYSLHNLAKAFLLLKHNTRPPGYHGLAKTTMAPSLLDISAETNNGLLVSLAAALGITIPLKKRFTLRDFVRNVIELREALQDYFQESTFYEEPEVAAFIKGELEVRFNVKNQSPADFLSNIREHTCLLDDFDFSLESGSVVLVPKSPFRDYPDFPNEVIPVLERHFAYSVFQADEYYVKIAPSEVSLPPAVAYLGYSFLLSSIVRYSPESLERFAHSRVTSNEWFLEELCSKAERVLPNILLNELHGVLIKFGVWPDMG